MDIDDAEGVVRAHRMMVVRQARSIARRWRGHVETDDLVGVGLLAVVRAARTFDDARRVPFEAHGSRAARWAMLSEARTKAAVNRGVIERRRALLEAEAAVEQRLGRQAAAEDIAAELGVLPDAVLRWQVQAASVERVAIEEVGPRLASHEPQPEDRVLDDELGRALHLAVAALPPRLALVVERTYFDERPLLEVARDLGVSESRVSQLRAEAVALLRDGLRLLLPDEDAAGGSGDLAPAALVPARLRDYRRAVAARAAASGRGA